MCLSRLIRVSVGMEDIEVRTCTQRHLPSVTATHPVPSSFTLCTVSNHSHLTMVYCLNMTCVVCLYLIFCCCCYLFYSNCIPHSSLLSHLIPLSSLFILHPSLFSLSRSLSLSLSLFTQHLKGVFSRALAAALPHTSVPAKL